MQIITDRDRDTEELEISFIENVLGLKNEGDEARVVRVNASGLNRLAYLEIKRKEDK